MSITKTNAIDIEGKHWTLFDSKYSVWLRNIAKSKYGLSPTDAEEMVQQVWLKVWLFSQRPLNPGEPWFEIQDGRLCFRPFLTTLLRNVAMDHFRRSKPTQPLPASVPSTTDGSASDDSSDEMELIAALLGSPEKIKGWLSTLWQPWRETEELQFQAIVLLFKEGRTPAEIMKKLNRSKGWVSMAKNRFLTAIRTHIQRLTSLTPLSER